MPQERRLWKAVWDNFMKSLKPKQTKGNLIGEDHMGNKYFEIPADPSVGKRKSNRYFQPLIKDRFDQEMPAEWEAWLRGRRKEPPTEDEVLMNEAIADLKKINAAKLEQEQHPEGIEPKKETLPKDFPKYEDYEIAPGSHQDKDEKK